eukprot:scaffold160299_cov66-Attheya_sp.AAC.2
MSAAVQIVGYVKFWKQIYANGDARWNKTLQSITSGNQRRRQVKRIMDSHQAEAPGTVLSKNKEGSNCSR